MSWGYKIAILYTGFVVLILTMVSLTMREKVDLVSKNYYEQELQYQDKIDKMERARSLKEPLTWEVGREVLTLKFPEQNAGQKATGNIYFFRPSDASMDKTIPVAADADGMQNIPSSQLKKGLYKMQINWTVNKVEYYNEGIIQIH